MKKRWIAFGLLAVVIAIACVAVRITVSRDANNDPKGLSKALNCQRDTADYRNTDVFCTDQFFKSRHVTTDETYQYMNCFEVLSPDYNKNMVYDDGNGPAAAAQAKQQDEATNAHNRKTCTDKTLLEQARRDLAHRLSQQTGVAIH